MISHLNVIIYWLRTKRSLLKSDHSRFNNGYNVTRYQSPFYAPACGIEQLEYNSTSVCRYTSTWSYYVIYYYICTIQQIIMIFSLFLWTDKLIDNFVSCMISKTILKIKLDLPLVAQAFRCIGSTWYTSVGRRSSVQVSLPLINKVLLGLG